MTSSTRTPTLAALCAGGFLASLWALFQWAELLVARAGGTPFCSLSATFDCSAVWDSPFAKAVHNATMVPVAGWGLMWGIVAFALPLLALVDTARLQRGLGAALRLTAIAGGVSVIVLAGASLAAGHVCIGCMGTYVVVGAWSVGAFFATRSFGFAEVQKGVFWAGGLTVASYLALLGPGMLTPHALGDVGKNAIANASAAAGSANAGAHGGANAGANAGTGDNGPRADNGPGPFDGPSTGDPNKDEALTALMAQLPPDAKQVMANLLAAYDNEAQAPAVPAARAIVGDKNAAVTIVDWTDPLCPHCAELHEVLDEIRRAVPPGSLAIEPHFFPLDGLCNPSVQRKNDTGEIRCAATKALLCLEDDPGKLALAQKEVFENQARLSSLDNLWEILKPIADKSKLEACMATPETQQKLDADIDAANKNHLEGTPLVLVNGKEVQPFGPILYSLVLTGGKTHAAPLKVLPAPKAPAPHP